MDGLEWIRNTEEGRGKEESKQNEKGSSRRQRDVGAPADVGAPRLAEDPIPEGSRETKERSEIQRRLWTPHGHGRDIFSLKFTFQLFLEMIFTYKSFR
jgi:hypothetical protein